MGFLRGVADWARNNIPIIGSSIAAVVEGVESAIESWSSALWDAARRVSEFFAWLWISVSAAGERLSRLVQDWWWGIYYFFTNLYGTVYYFFSYVWDSFRDWVTARIVDFTNWLNGVWRSLEPSIRWVIDGWSSFVSDPWGHVRRTIEQIWGVIYDRVRPFLTELSNRIEGTRGWLLDRVEELRRSVQAAIDTLGTNLRNTEAALRASISDLGNRFEAFRRDAVNWLNNLGAEVQRLVRDFADQALKSISIWEAAKGAARRKLAEDIANVMEKPEAQAAIMGGETAAWVAHPALGAAVTGTTLLLENWSTWMKEHPVELPIQSDNPVVRQLFGDREVEFEGPTEYSFGELLDQPPAVVYEWSEVSPGRFELVVVEPRE